jgi:WD40 repeat protein
MIECSNFKIKTQLYFDTIYSPLLLYDAHNYCNDCNILSADRQYIKLWNCENLLNTFKQPIPIDAKHLFCAHHPLIPTIYFTGRIDHRYCIYTYNSVHDKIDLLSSYSYPLWQFKFIESGMSYYICKKNKNKTFSNCICEVENNMIVYDIKENATIQKALYNEEHRIIVNGALDGTVKIYDKRSKKKSILNFKHTSSLQDMASSNFYLYITNGSQISQHDIRFPYKCIHEFCPTSDVLALTCNDNFFIYRNKTDINICKYNNCSINISLNYRNISSLLLNNYNELYVSANNCFFMHKII